MGQCHKVESLSREEILQRTETHNLVSFSFLQSSEGSWIDKSTGRAAKLTGLDDREGRYVSLLHSVQTGFGVHSAYSVATAGSFPGGKVTGA
jgi:hypothetical protein